MQEIERLVTARLGAQSVFTMCPCLAGTIRVEWAPRGKGACLGGLGLVPNFSGIRRSISRIDGAARVVLWFGPQGKVEVVAGQATQGYVGGGWRGREGREGRSRSVRGPSQG